jgi:hypothetical protein
MAGDMFMKKILIIASLLVSIGSWATPLSTLLNGGTITAGDKLFDQWELFLDDSEFGIDTSLIEVTPLNDGGLDPGPGLHFELLGPGWTIFGNGFWNYLDFSFGFRASVIDPNSGLKIKDNSLTLLDAFVYNDNFEPAFDLASVYINETVYSDGNRNNEIGFKDVEMSDVGGQLTQDLFDNTVFAPASEIWITKNILLEATDFMNMAELRSFEQRFSQTADIPEPTSLILLAVGLFGLLARQKPV